MQWREKEKKNLWEKIDNSMIERPIIDRPFRGTMCIPSVYQANTAYGEFVVYIVGQF